MKNNTNPSDGRLHGFPKGWTIFMIVYISAFAVTMLPNAGRAPALILPLLLFLAGMIAGLALMLKRRAYGFWVLLGSSVLITAINGAHSGGYTVFTSGGLGLVIITFFIVRKQLGIFGKKSAPAANPSQPVTGSQPATGSQPMTGSQPAAGGKQELTSLQLITEFGSAFISLIKKAMSEAESGTYNSASAGIPRKVALKTKGFRLSDSDVAIMTKAAGIALNDSADLVASKYRIPKNEIFGRLWPNTDTVTVTMTYTPPNDFGYDLDIDEKVAHMVGVELDKAAGN